MPRKSGSVRGAARKGRPYRDRITITPGSPQMIALTPRAPATDGASADDHRRVQETLKVMATVKKDRLAATVEKVCDVTYELIS